MTGILVTGHGHFASGIVSAAELILGKQEQLWAVDFPEGDTKTELDANIKKALDDMKEMEHILVFCDLLSGSPFNTVVECTLRTENVKVFYGTNLGMLMETVMNRNLGFEWEEILSGIVECGKGAVGEFAPENETEDEEWD